MMANNNSDDMEKDEERKRLPIFGFLLLATVFGVVTVKVLALVLVP